MRLEGKELSLVRKSADKGQERQFGEDALWPQVTTNASHIPIPFLISSRIRRESRCKDLR